MIDTKKNETRPAVSWVPVRDSDGRTHMEARWTLSEPHHAQAA
ncbi:hypothetical protein [Nocardioides gilvus]|nr:hypothetical protein [Nocardioides gilvus]